MERLTKRINGYAYGLCGRTKDIALTKKYGFKRGSFECTGIIDHLAELEDEIENGTLVELPKLKYAITVDIKSSKNPNYLIKERVPYAEYWESKWHMGYKPMEWCIRIIAEYDTREEAEKRLEELSDAERKKI